MVSQLVVNDPVLGISGKPLAAASAALKSVMNACQAWMYVWPPSSAIAVSRAPVPVRRGSAGLCASHCRRSGAAESANSPS